VIIDIAAGIALALLVAHVFGFFASPLFILAGIACALFPDIYTILSRNSALRRVIGEHRSAIHYPLPYIVILPIVWLVFGNAPVLLFSLGVFYHLAHDTFFLGYGIKWLWPFSERSFSFFHDKDGRITSDILIWEPKDDARIRAIYQSPHWIRDFYFRPSWISLTEYPALVLAVILLYRHFFN